MKHHKQRLAPYPSESFPAKVQGGVFFNAASKHGQLSSFFWQSALADNIVSISSYVCATEIISEVSAPAEVT